MFDIDNKKQTARSWTDQKITALSIYFLTAGPKSTTSVRKRFRAKTKILNFKLLYKLSNTTNKTGL